MVSGQRICGRMWLDSSCCIISTSFVSYCKMFSHEYLSYLSVKEITTGKILTRLVTLTTPALQWVTLNTHVQKVCSGYLKIRWSWKRISIWLLACIPKVLYKPIPRSPLVAHERNKWVNSYCLLTFWNFLDCEVIINFTNMPLNSMETVNTSVLL